MKLYVVRHGQTGWNLLHKMQGVVDIPLNQKGREQAMETKKNLNNINIDLILCSPLKRARETALIINEDKCVPIIYEGSLIERDYGEFEGVNRNDFSYDDFWAYSKNIKYERAENIQEFFNRIYKFLDEVKNKYNNKNVLIVCHGGVTKAIKCYADGMMSDEEISEFLPSNAMVLEYEIRE